MWEANKAERLAKQQETYNGRRTSCQSGGRCDLKSERSGQVQALTESEKRDLPKTYAQYVQHNWPLKYRTLAPLVR